MKTRHSKCAAVVAMFVAALLAGCAEKPESMLKSAKEFLGKNDRGAAVIQLRNALQKNPDLAEARFLLGKSLLETGELTAAEKELRKASEINYSPDEVIPVLANVLVLRGEYKKAVDEFGTTTLTAPQAKAELQAALGQAHLALGNSELAKDKFETALVLVPDFPPALIGQARMTAVAGDLPGALALVERAVAKAPTLSEGWKFRGDLLNTEGKADEALVAYRKAVEVDPYNPEAHYIVVALLIQQNKTVEAGKQLAAMQKIAPKHPQTLYLQALLAFHQQNFTAARDAILQHMKVAPDNPVGLLLSARINYQLQAYTQVEAELRKVLKQFPNERTARQLLVQTYLHISQPSKALETMTPLLDEQDLNADTLRLIGNVYAWNRDMVKSTKFLEKSVALDPANPSRRTTLALANLARGEGGQGFQELEEAAASDKGIRADVALILANVQQRKFEAALAAVAVLEKKHPDNPLPYNLRGAVMLVKGDAAGARKSFEDAVAKDPADFAAAGSLARLDLAEKKPDDAKKRFEAVLAKDPKRVPALLALAGLRARGGGSTEEVVKLIGKAVEADPADPAPRLALITYYLQRKEPKLAVTVAQEALTLLPDRPEILDGVGKAYWAAGDTNQAFTTYAKLAQLQPSSTLPLMRMAELQLSANDSVAALESARKALAIKPDLVEAQRMVAVLDLNAGRGSAALAMARDIQKRHPKESAGYLLEGDIRARQDAWGEAAAAYRNGLKQAGTTDLAIKESLAMYASGSDAEAEKFNASWLKDHPKDVFFRGYVADISVVKKDFSGAAKIYKMILETQPDNAVVAVRISRAMYANGSDAEAEKFNASWLKDHPNDVYFHGYLADTAMGKKDFAGAARQYRTVLESEPDNATVLNNLAWVSGQLRDPKAIEYAEKAAKLTPQSPAALDTLGALLIDSGDTKRGVELLQKAVALAPTIPAIRLNLARALVTDGQKEAAKKELNVLEELGDKFPDQAVVAKLKQGL